MSSSQSETAPSTASTDLARRRYGAAAIGLHWTIALLIFIQIGLGWYMNEVLPDHSPAQAAVLTLHISVGLTIFLLVLVRIAVRLINRPPPLPPGMPLWERTLARTSHVVFYLLLLALPLTGWALESLGTRPIRFWGLPWPHLPGIAALFGAAPPRPVRHELSHIHVYILIWIVLINLALHVAGALKHQFDGRPVLWRMLPIKALGAPPGR
ncbi:MAG TPA: cytochrome b/b6 domain-containing protein [Caulobacteraceae bacterium]|jgi:cytochrome b561|nr:cytochrome b/b6 domain-containing protein [Caulobacteraceae bacterium]